MKFSKKEYNYLLVSSFNTLQNTYGKARKCASKLIFKLYKMSGKKPDAMLYQIMSDSQKKKYDIKLQKAMIREGIREQAKKYKMTQKEYWKRFCEEGTF